MNERFKSAMVRAGVSGADLARLAGCSRAMISMIISEERDIAAISLGTADLIAAALGISMDELLAMSDSERTHKMMFQKSYEAKLKVLEAGNSKMFNDWQQHSTITKEQFADALAWVHEDPRNYAALTADGWKKVHRYTEGVMEVFRTLDGHIWEGEPFIQKLTEKEARFYGEDTIRVIQKIAMRAADRI